MDDLARWYGEQLNVDERIARAVTTEGAWRVGSSHGGASVEGEGWTVAGADALDGAHIGEHDPARVLREIEAKRRILAEVVPEIDAMEARIDGEWGAGDSGERESVALLRLLALPYADRPGYREEWRP